MELRYKDIYNKIAIENPKKIKDGNNKIVHEFPFKIVSE